MQLNGIGWLFAIEERRSRSSFSRCSDAQIFLQDLGVMDWHKFNTYFKLNVIINILKYVLYWNSIECAVLFLFKIVFQIQSIRCIISSIQQL